MACTANHTGNKFCRLCGERQTPENPIKRFSTETKEGHTLQFFFNKETNLVVVDYIHKNERGGNEVLRKTLDPIMLSHCERGKRGKA